MSAQERIITLFAVISFLVGWAANPNTCSAQGYCYQVPAMQVYSYSLLPYPNYYAYSLAVPVPSGYYVVSPPPRSYKYGHKYRHKYKHKHKHRY